MWTQETEAQFFRWAIDERGCSLETLFYKVGNRYLFYLPNGTRGQGDVRQGRNPLVGEFTEKWAEKFLAPIVSEVGLHLVRNVTVPAWGLVGQRAADLAICRTSSRSPKPSDVVALLEVKMSLVWNWEWQPAQKTVSCIGDFRTHQGRPSVLRSDTVLKALGKAIEVRGMGFSGAFLVLCNTPVASDYFRQIDGCRRIGIVQGFFSVNPQPTKDGQHNPKRSPEGGFYRWDEPAEVKARLEEMLSEQRHFFSGFLPLSVLGHLIERACCEPTLSQKAHRFLDGLREVSE